ncbi:MAG: hypothetical protein WC705_02050 [Candidatus Paceibacterota bacterium]|jgi:hypothetical protein
MERGKKKIIRVVDIVRNISSGSRRNDVSDFRKIKSESDDLRIMKEIESSKVEDDDIKFEESREIFENRSKGKTKKGKKILWLGIGLAVLVIAYFVLASLPKVNIEIFTKKVPWEFNDSIIVNKNINQIEIDSKQIPGEIITKNANHTFYYTPNGKKYVEIKAKGTITILNNFGTSPQTLVATTRFQTSDGKIFRLVNSITVPGGKMVDGKLQTGTIDAQVVADKAGPEYNIGAQEKLTIPGFLNSERYNKFWGKSDKPMTGGSLGEGLVATQEDIKKAEENSLKEIKDIIIGSITSSLPEGLSKPVDGSTSFVVKKKEVISDLNGDNKFGFFVEGEVSAIVFKESDILSLLKKLSEKDSVPENFLAQNNKLEYGSPSNDWKIGKMTLPIKYSDIFSPKIDSQLITQEILGKNEVDLKKYMLSINGVDKLNVSFWPFWVGDVTKNKDRVKITIE